MVTTTRWCPCWYWCRTPPVPRVCASMCARMCWWDFQRWEGSCAAAIAAAAAAAAAADDDDDDDYDDDGDDNGDDNYDDNGDDGNGDDAYICFCPREGWGADGCVSG